MLAEATIRTYQRRSGEYFRARRHRIIGAAVILSPVIADPEIPLSVIMIVADTNAPPLWRIVAGSSVFVVTQMWVLTQRPFVPNLDDFTILGTKNGPARFLLARMASGVVISWPLLPIVVSLVVLGGSSSLVWVFTIIGLSRVTTAIVRVRSGRISWPYANYSSRFGVLLKQSVCDVSPLRPSNAARYALSCMVFAVATAISERFEHRMFELLIGGAAVSSLSIRNMADACLRRTLAAAPILEFTDLRLLCSVRCVVGFVVLICLQGVVSIGFGIRGGDVGSWWVSFGVVAALGGGFASARFLGLPRHADWVLSIFSIALVRWIS